MNLRELAEAVILQSLEDLQDPVWRIECMEFFQGWRFRQCAELAGMTHHEMSLIMDIVSAQKKLYTAYPGPGFKRGKSHSGELVLKTTPRDEENMLESRRTGHAH